MSVLGAHHHEIKQLRRLLGRRSARRDAGVFVVEGPIVVREAVAAGADVRAVYADATCADPAWLDVGGVAVSVVSEGVLSSVLTTTTPQPVCAVVGVPSFDTADLLDDAATAARPVLMCSGVSDPGNAGTLIRAAHASGCAAVVFADSSVDAFNPKTVRSTAGSLFRVPVLNDALGAEVLGLAGDRAIDSWAMVASTDGAVDHTDAPLDGVAVLVVGSEAHGLDEAVLAACTGRVTIPMEPTAESLNAAMAGTVLCFEARRQRGAGSA